MAGHGKNTDETGATIATTAVFGQTFYHTVLRSYGGPTVLRGPSTRGTTVPNVVGKPFTWYQVLRFILLRPPRPRVDTVNFNSFIKIGCWTMYRVPHVDRAPHVSSFIHSYT